MTSTQAPIYRRNARYQRNDPIQGQGGMTSAIPRYKGGAAMTSADPRYKRNANDKANRLDYQAIVAHIRAE
jgi:hypothetical protein